MSVHRDKVKLLVVGSPAFLRGIQHLFEGQPNFELVKNRGGSRNFVSRQERRVPRLIVACVKPVGTNVRAAVRAIKRSSPRSKLILICPVRDFCNGARESGADACLDPAELIRRLVPVALVLTAPGRSPVARSSVR